jgi:LysM repeat protein
VQSTPKGDAGTIASAVIRGEYGNDPQRHALLGSRYDEVMSIVNQRLSGSSASGTGYYTVQPGDYLSRIWPSSWRSIAALNGLTPPYLIYPGQRLSTTGAPASGRSVVVRPGDTLTGIAARLGVSASSLHGYRSGNPNLIYTGETLAY